jgi:hypothetical protein
MPIGEKRGGAMSPEWEYEEEEEEDVMLVAWVVMVP